MVASYNEEGKGAKNLLKWVENGTTTFQEIEDCIIWIRDVQINYGLSLSRVPAALREFQKVKRKLPNGRFTGTALNSYKTKDEKTIDNLRNMPQTTPDELAEYKAQKAYLNQFNQK